MKPGKIVLAIVFFILFIVCIFVVVKGWRNYTYTSVFPEDVTTIIHLQRPMDTPLKILNSTAVNKFFSTKYGKEQLKTLNETLAAMGGGGGDQPPMYKGEIEGVTVFYPGASPPKPENAKPKAGGKKMSLDEIKKGMMIGGAVVTDIYVALYGNPMDFMNTGQASFMVALDLGRIASLPEKVLSGKAKPVAQFPKDQDKKIAFAFIRNLVIVGDPQGVERMIHVAHGTPMKAKITKTVTEPDSTQEVVVTEQIDLNVKPLSNSKVWSNIQAAGLPKNVDFELTLIVPNLVKTLESDEEIKKTIADANKNYGLDKIQAFDLSTESGPDGLKIRTTILADAGSPILKIIDQPEVEMKHNNLLPTGFQIGAGMNAGNYSSLYTDLNLLLGESSPLKPIGESISKIFGIADPAAFLANLGGEVSIMVFKTGDKSHNIYCMDAASGMQKWLEDTEANIATSLIATAEANIQAAKAGDAAAFASQMLTEAETELDHAKKALEEGVPVESVASARRASRLASDALLALYKEAETIILEAELNSSNPWGYPSEVQEARVVLDAAKAAYDAKNSAEGVSLSRKSLEMANAISAMSKAAELIQSAKEGPALVLAKTAIGQANTAWKAKNYAAAKTAAVSAKTAAKQAGGALSGSDTEESPGSAENKDLPQTDSPREIAGTMVYLTVGESAMEYAFLDNNKTICMGAPVDIEAYFGSERGKALVNQKAQELFKSIPKAVQGEAIIDLYSMLITEETKALLPDPELEPYIQSLNLTMGTYIETTPTKATITTVLPIKLFDGKTTGGVRTATSLVLVVLKILLYLLTALFIYLTVRMVMPKEKKLI